MTPILTLAEHGNSSNSLDNTPAALRLNLRNKDSLSSNSSNNSTDHNNKPVACPVFRAEVRAQRKDIRPRAALLP